MNETLTDIKDILKDTPTRKEFNEIDKRVTALEAYKDEIIENADIAHNTLEEQMVSKKEFKIGLTTITIAISLIIGAITIWNNLRGI